MSTMLTYTATANNGDRWSFSVELDQYDYGQQCYRYRWIVENNGEVLASAADLRCGSSSPDQRPESLARMLETLFSFLSAWDESIRYESYSGRTGENADLFSPDLLPLLDAFSGDELTLFGDEVWGDDD